MSTRIPKYRFHKGSGQALVQINRLRIYLGKYGSEESKEKYRRHVAEWLASGGAANREAPVTGGSQAPICVNDLILAFWTFAEQRYVKNGKPTSEIKSFKTALRPLHDLYGSQPVSDFGPLALVACRQQLIEQGLCRKRINQHASWRGLPDSGHRLENGQRCLGIPSPFPQRSAPWTGANTKSSSSARMPRRSSSPG